jgi:DNA (cytosine-5)-methyltransferase 1
MGKYYEFFAGGGMASAGLGAGWECVFANDFCPNKADAYKSNWGAKHLCVGDIADVKLEQLNEAADLAWASFPCQDLSLAGNGKGLKGEHSGVFWDFVDLMKELRAAKRAPKIIALENVLGAITSHDGDDFQEIIRATAALGYRVGAMVIDAVHFVPQSRPRLFVVALDRRFAPPVSLHSDGPTAAWHPTAIIRAHNELPHELKDEWIWWRLPEPEAGTRTLEEIIEEEPEGVEWHTAEETKRLLDLMTDLNKKKVEQAKSAGQIKVGTIYKRTRYGKQRAEVRFDGIAGCLRTPRGGSSRQTIIVVNKNEVRSRLLSPREAARLMGLDDEYVLPQRRNEAYRLIGDGVAVPVVSHLARHIFEPALRLSTST